MSTFQTFTFSFSLVVAASVSGCGGEPARDANERDVAFGDTSDAALEADGDSEDDVAVDAADSVDGDPADAADSAPLVPLPIVVMTYNVMCSFCVNSDHSGWEHAWDARLPWLQDVIARHDPDLVGLQELAAFNEDVDEVAQLSRDGIYSSVFYERVPGDTLLVDYPDATILYREARFEKLEDGHFWLGPNPETSFSGGWASGGNLPRLVVWARLRDRSSEVEFVFANTHFDNNQPNQERSAELSLQRLEVIAGERPLIFAGDFNSNPTSTAYGILTADGSGALPTLLDTYELAGDDVRAISNFAPPQGHYASRRIDHVFVAGLDYSVADWVVDMFTYGEQHQFPSDHLAIVTTFAPR